jgi:hypothetical protein
MLIAESVGNRNASQGLIVPVILLGTAILLCQPTLPNGHILCSAACPI